jgi:hypothetical protein
MTPVRRYRDRLDLTVCTAMTLSFSAKALVATALLGMPLSVLAQTGAPQPSQPGDSAPSCRQMIDKAESAIVRMAAGVEKMAAQKEIASAKLDMAHGDSVSCNSHVKNAMQALQAKGSK